MKHLSKLNVRALQAQDDEESTRNAGETQVQSLGRRLLEGVW